MLYPIAVPNKVTVVSVSAVINLFSKVGSFVLVVDTEPTVKPAFVIAVLAAVFVVPR